jgi:Protein of unknown function (DUF4240)
MGVRSIIHFLKKKVAAFSELASLTNDHDENMSEEGFWKIIGLFDWSNNTDNSAIIEPAVAVLAAMPVEQIFQFEDILSEKLWQLDTREHAKASIVSEGEDGYLSADGFLYDRCSVVANGREYFQNILKNPAEFPEGYSFETLLYVALDAFKRKTGAEPDHIPKFNYETGSNTTGWPEGVD